MALESDQLIEALTAHYKTLLRENWLELWAFRDGDKPRKSSVSFQIEPNGRDYTLYSRLNYGIRISRHMKVPFSPLPQDKPQPQRSEPLLRAG